MIDPQSNVDMIEYCLATPPDEHAMECDEEWFGWVEGLGERPAMYLAMPALGPGLGFLSAVMSWDYWRSLAGVAAPEVSRLRDADVSGSQQGSGS